MEWFKFAKKGIEKSTRPREIPDDKWIKCPDCNEIHFREAMEKLLWVCKKCDYHLKVPSEQYLSFLLDKDTFTEINSSMTSRDILEFKDKITYAKRIVASREKSGKMEAIATGSGRMNGYAVAIGVMDFSFMGGSMGSVVGEKISRLIQHAIDQDLPVIIISASGGARMQEGAVSLMQMAKTAAMLGRLDQARIPYISVLTNPTTGGVTASYSMLGDIIIAEPKALIGFAGPRVIRETIRQELPPNFQRSEFLMEHGFLDIISDRRELKQTITTILDHIWGRNRVEVPQKEKSDLYVDVKGELKNIPRK